MKKLLSLTIIFVLVFCMMAGCAANANQPDETDRIDKTDTLDDFELPDEPGMPDEPDLPDEPVQPDISSRPPIDASNLSADPFSFQVSFDGSAVQFPCAASDLMALGYSFGDKADNILENGYFTSASMVLNDNRIFVGILNISGEDKKFSECTIKSVSVYANYSEGQTIYISNGITFGMTPEDIMAIYGNEPDYKYESDSYLSLKYEVDYANYIEFTFNDESLNEIYINSTP